MDMKDFTKAYPGRAMREFWTFDDNSYTVKQCQGFSCGPGNEMWWCPEMGFSTGNASLFKTKQEATANALKRATKERDELNVIVARLERSK
jgi:hypothetical protein